MSMNGHTRYQRRVADTFSNLETEKVEMAGGRGHEELFDSIFLADER